MKTTEKLIEAVRAMRCLDSMGRDLVEAPEEHRPVIQARIDSIHRAAEEALFAATRPSKPVAAGTCSECSGVLEDGMGCRAKDGRCGSCLYEEGERARKAREARYEGLTDRQRMSKVLAAEHQRQQGEGYGPGREE